MVEVSKISRSFVLLLILSVVLFDVQARPINKINGASQMITPLADRPSAGGSGHRSSPGFTSHKLGTQEVIPLAQGGPSPRGGGHSCPGCG